MQTPKNTQFIQELMHGSLIKAIDPSDGSEYDLRVTPTTQTIRASKLIAQHEALIEQMAMHLNRQQAEIEHLSKLLYPEGKNDEPQTAAV